LISFFNQEKMVAAVTTTKLPMIIYQRVFSRSSPNMSVKNEITIIATKVPVRIYNR